MPIWSEHVQDPALASNLTRRVDFAKFMVHSLTADDVLRQAPAICGCQTPSGIIQIHFFEIFSFAKFETAHI